MEFKEFMNRVRKATKNSPVSHHLKGEMPEYDPGSYADFNLRFQFGKGWSGEECRIDFRAKRNRKDREEEEIEDGGRKIVEQFEECELTVKWNGLADRDVDDADVALSFYQDVTDLAKEINYLMKHYELRDTYIELPKPEDPNDLDLIASYDDPEEGLASYKKEELKEMARENDLKVSGNKPELKERIAKYAEKEGDPSKVEKKNEWYENRFQSAK